MIIMVFVSILYGLAVIALWKVLRTLNKPRASFPETRSPQQDKLQDIEPADSQ